MFRLIRFLFLLAIVVAAGLAATVLYLRQVGVSARRPPTRIETALATRLRHLAIPAADRDRANPVPKTAEAVHDGLEHFADHCAVCHGNDGRGDTMFGRALYPPPPDLRLARTQQLSDGEIFAIIENGVRFTGMPAFGGGGAEAESHQGDSHEADEHGPDSTWKLVAFIRHLPRLTDAELAHMKSLNPRSPAEADEDQKEEDFLNGGKPAPPHDHEHGGRGEK